MKRRILITLTASVTLFVFFACKKTDFKMRADYVDLSNKAFVRFIHASPSFKLVNGNQKDSFNLYVNNLKLNGPIITYGGVFPVNTTSSYAAVDAGIQTYRLAIAGVINPDSVTIRSSPDTLKPGTKRMLLLTDSGVVRIADNISMPLTGLYNLRFINLVLNDTAGKTVDIYSTRRNANIFTNVKPYSPGVIIISLSLAYNSQLNDTLFVRRSGTVFNLAQGTLASGLAYLPGNQRTYTLFYRGDGNLTTGTKARTLAMITNQ